MAKKRKRKSKGKKKTAATIGGPTGLWCTQDLDWDSKGCLQIKNAYLGLAMERYFHDPKHAKCDVWMYDPNAPGQKVNVQCC